MTRRFTKILAAVALLVGLTIPMTGWAEEFTYDFSTRGTHNSNVNPITNTWVTDYFTILQEKGTSNTAVANYLTAPRWYQNHLITITPATNITITSIVINCSSTNNGQTITASIGSVTANGNNSTWTGSITSTSPVVLTMGKQCRPGSLVVTYTTSGGTPTCATPTFNPAAGTYTEAQNVSINCATEGATIYYTTNGEEPTTSSSVYSGTISVSTTTTIKAMAAKADYNNSSVASATYTIVQPISGYAIDFEQEASLYTDWTFTNMESKQTGNSNVTAHGGTYYGTTGGKASASITTKAPVAAPGTLTCFVTKQSTNTTASTWYIQVSEDNSSWTNVATQNAASMTAGTWVEFTADLTTYSNVYVRVYYTGSTAVRNIDDLSLSMNNNPAIVANDVEIDYNATSGSIEYTITNGVEGGAVTSAVVTASNPENWLTVNGSNPYTSPISLSCAVNTTATQKTATVTLTYTYNRETVTETVNVTQAADPNATMTIAEVRALNTGTTVATKGVVTSISVSGNNKTAYFQDNTAGIVAYGPFTTTVAVGDEIRVEGELTSYNGLLEIGKSSAAPTVTVLSQNNTVTPVVKTIAEISNIIQAQLVKVENATVTAKDGQNTTIAQGQNTIVVRGISGVEYAVNDILTLTANVGCYNNNPQLVNPQNVEVQVVPVITYLVNFSLDGGTFVPNNVFTDAIVEIEAGTYALPSATKDGFTFAGWYDGTNTYQAGSEYSVSDNIDFTAQWVVSFNVTYDFSSANNFYTEAGGDVHPATGSTNNVNEFYYGNGDKFTASGTSHYFGETNAPYFLFGKSGALLNLPTFANTYKITKITLHSSSSGSQSVQVAIVSGENIVADAQTWVNRDADYIYTIPAEYQESVLSVKVVSSHNAQITAITLEREAIEPATESLQKTLIADRWYIIASPFAGTLTTNAMDASNLYFYDEQDHFWRSKTFHENDFDFASGTGYLCGNKNDNFELTFEGTVSEDDIMEIPLTYHATTTANEDNPLAGWNLVGNPFATTAEISNEYYIINEDGNGLIAGESYVVDAMQGVFVQATSEGQAVIFEKAEVGVGGGDDKLVVNLSQNRSNIIDRAIVRFGEGRQLPKFQLFEDNTKLYIPQDGQDYAVVRSEGQGELPVNFRASENGTYTLSLDVENMDMNYLHLIDNMTGMDVDLLQTPSYTFEAKVNDYESRFRLVFAANNEDGASTGSTAFAFFSNGSWIINNAGEATLQVVDLTGRILSSETVNGSVSTTINAVPGVYMLRLINGENVNVQKIVVR